MILQQTIEQVIQEWPTLSTKESGSALVAKTLGEGIHPKSNRIIMHKK